MKRMYRLTAAALAACLLLAGCGATASAPASQAASSSAAQEQEDAYAYLADFDYSSLFDAKGYVDGVAAADYVTLPEGFDALTLPAGTDTVTDETLEEQINSQILSQFQHYEQITDRAAEMGDTVHIDYVGSVDGVEFDGGNTQGNGTDLQLTGSNYIDDFEEQIAGHMPGETFNVEVTFPDPYPNEENNNPDLAGKDAVFVTTLHYIQGDAITPELTDEFVQENIDPALGFTTAEEVRAYMREQLAYNQQATAIITQVVAGTKYADEMPQAVLDYCRDLALLEFYPYTQYFGMSMDEVIQAQTGAGSTEAYLEDTVPTRAHNLLLIQALAEKLGIACDEATLREKFEDYYSTYDLDELIPNYGQGYIMNDVLQYLVLDDLIAKSTVAAE